MNSGWISNPVKPLDCEMEAQALARQGQLTKPPGALGQLEELAVRLAAMQGVERPALEKRPSPFLPPTTAWPMRTCLPFRKR